MATQLKVDRPINGSGLDPADQRVVVLPDETPEKTGGGLFLPDQVRDQKKFAMQTATVVAVGPLAYAEGRYDAERFGVAARWPSVGDRVRIGKYAGDSFDGADGRRYTLLNDEDILGHLVD